MEALLKHVQDLGSWEPDKETAAADALSALVQRSSEPAQAMLGLGVVDSSVTALMNRLAGLKDKTVANPAAIERSLIARLELLRGLLVVTGNHSRFTDAGLPAVLSTFRDVTSIGPQLRLTGMDVRFWVLLRSKASVPYTEEDFWAMTVPRDICGKLHTTQMLALLARLEIVPEYVDKQAMASFLLQGFRQNSYARRPAALALLCMTRTEAGGKAILEADWEETLLVHISTESLVFCHWAATILAQLKVVCGGSITLADKLAERELMPAVLALLSSPEPSHQSAASRLLCWCWTEDLEVRRPLLSSFLDSLSGLDATGPRLRSWQATCAPFQEPLVAQGLVGKLNEGPAWAAQASVLIYNLTVYEGGWVALVGAGAVQMVTQVLLKEADPLDLYPMGWLHLRHGLMLAILALCGGSLDGVCVVPSLSRPWPGMSWVGSNWGDMTYASDALKMFVAADGVQLLRSPDDDDFTHPWQLLMCVLLLRSDATQFEPSGAGVVDVPLCLWDTKDGLGAVQAIAEVAPGRRAIAASLELPKLFAVLNSSNMSEYEENSGLQLIKALLRDPGAAALVVTHGASRSCRGLIEEWNSSLAKTDVGGLLKHFDARAREFNLEPELLSADVLLLQDRHA